MCVCVWHASEKDDTKLFRNDTKTAWMTQKTFEWYKNTRRMIQKKRTEWYKQLSWKPARMIQKNADPSHSIPGRKELDPIGLRSLLIDYFGVRLVMVPPQSRPASHNLLLPKSRRYRWSRGESSRMRARGVWQAPRAHSLTVHAVLTCSLASGRDGGRVLAILSRFFSLLSWRLLKAMLYFRNWQKWWTPTRISTVLMGVTADPH